MFVAILFKDALLFLITAGKQIKQLLTGTELLKAKKGTKVFPRVYYISNDLVRLLWNSKRKPIAKSQSMWSALIIRMACDWLIVKYFDLLMLLLSSFFFNFVLFQLQPMRQHSANNNTNGVVPVIWGLRV